MEAAADAVVVIREYEPSTDLDRVEAVERSCEVGPSGETSIYTDLLGDPLCRVRLSPAFVMLVAETCGPVKEIVGLVRGCIKTVTCGTKLPTRTAQHRTPIYTKLAYILGLRVSPSHRRMGIALKLVTRLESWFKERGAEYAYMATEKDNVASLRLFTARCGYRVFRTPSILVQPVHAHSVSTPIRRRRRHASVVRIPPSDAEALYRKRFSTAEFFPRDIDSILRNPLSLGTFVAVDGPGFEWAGSDSFLRDPPESWAVMSVWDSKAVFRLEVRGVPRWKRGLLKAARVMDRILPWLKLPSLPDLFRPFGFYLLYGLGGEGKRVVDLVRVLCGRAHDMARDGGSALVVAEVAGCEPLKRGIPRWKRLSCDEDLWCVKRLGGEYSDGEVGDWTKKPPGPTIFVDPREF